MFKTQIESGDILRLVLFSALAAVLVLIFAVGLNEAYAETESTYRDDGTLKETTEYYEENNWRYKLVTEYYKDGSVKTETYYRWSYWVFDYHPEYAFEYRTDGTLMKYSGYSVTNDVAWKNSTTKFNKDGFKIWTKHFENDGSFKYAYEYKYYNDGKLKKIVKGNNTDDQKHVTEYKYYNDGKLKKIVKVNNTDDQKHVTEYKYYNDGKLKKVLKDDTVDYSFGSWSGKTVTEYNKDWVCETGPCPKYVLPNKDITEMSDLCSKSPTCYPYHTDINWNNDRSTYYDYDYGGGPVKSTWYGDNGTTWAWANYWDDGEIKTKTKETGEKRGGPILYTTIHDESGKQLSSTTHYNGAVMYTGENNPDGSVLMTSYTDYGLHITDRIQSISEISPGVKTIKKTYLNADGTMRMWEYNIRYDHIVRYDANGDVMQIRYHNTSSLPAGWTESFNPHCPPDRVSDHSRANKPVCLPEPVQEYSTDGVTEQDESGRITKTTWRNTDCDLLEYEDRAYWSNGNISQIIKYDGDDNMIQFTYHDDSGNIYASHEYEDGEKTKSTFYRTDGSIYRVTEYNDDGNIFKITEYREDGSSYEVDP